MTPAEGEAQAARIKELEEINRQYVNALEREKTLCAKEWEYSQEHIKELIAEVERLHARIANALPVPIQWVEETDTLRTVNDAVKSD